jgi:tetratricopeptide (TPR) repeat protein
MTLPGRWPERSYHPVFISYARATSTEHARALHAALGGPDGLAFLDESDIHAGESIPSWVFDAMLSARVVVILVDATYFTRRYCLQEFRAAIRAFQVLAERGAHHAHVEEALRPLVVALPISGARPETMERLPPLTRDTNWPAVTEHARLVDLVRARLAVVSRTFGERLDRLGELSGLRDALAAATEVPAPRLLRGVPIYPRTGLRESLGEAFIGRAAELWQVHTALTTLGHGPRGAALTGALEGGGGIGKSRLAVEYLHRYGPENFSGGLFWIDADVPEDRVEAQLHGVLRTLRPDVPQLARFRQDMRDAAEELGEALSSLPPEQVVLYVVDNVPEPQAGQAPLPLSTWCPALGQVAVLVTSRFHQSVVGNVRSIPVHELRPSAAVALLTHRYGGRRGLAEHEWLRVADWVGELPLALELLNAALRAGALDATELPALVDSSNPAGELDRQMEALRGKVPRGALRGITEALRVSYDRLSSPARRAACLLAALAPDPIPMAAIEALGPDLMGATVRADMVTRSLVTPVTSADASTVAMFGRMHRVLADFLRSTVEDRVSDGELLSKALLQVMQPERCRDPGDWPLMDACRPHAEALLERLATVAPAEDLVHLLLQLGNRVELLVSEQGRVDRAAEIGAAALERAIVVYGPEHALTQYAKTNLALHLSALGELDRARTLAEEALAGHRRLFGEDHVETLQAKAGLATILHAQRRLEPAAALNEDVLGARRRALGDEHEDTAHVKGNLADTLCALGRLDRARQLAEEALGTLQRLHGEDHKDTLTMKGILAAILRELGDGPAAATLTAQALAAQRRLLGDDHNDTLTSKMGLAQLLRDEGELDEAEALERQVLEQRRRLLGEEHPDTLFTKLHLSLLLRDRGELAEASQVGEEAYAGRRGRLGADHPDTLEAMSSLAVLRHETGDDASAVALALELMAKQRAVLGPDHPQTMRTMAFVSALAFAQGDLARARTLAQEALDGRERRLGEDHPETLEAMAQFAALLAAMGDLEEARSLQEEVVEGACRCFGEEHPETLSTKCDLALTMAEIGDVDEARSLAVEVLTALEAQFGPDDARTQAAREDLGPILEASHWRRQRSRL